MRFRQMLPGRTVLLATALLVAGHQSDPGELHGQAQDAPQTVLEMEAQIRALEEAGDEPALASAHNSLGLLHWTEARYPEAVDHLTRARDIWAELEDVEALGRVYNNLGAAHYQWGNYEAALDAFFRARTFREESGDTRGEALVLTNIGRTYLDWEQLKDARSWLDEALEVAQRAGDPFAHGYALHNLGILELEEGNFPRARERFHESLPHYIRDDPQLTTSDAASGWALNTLGIAAAYVREGSPDTALPLLEEALARAEEGDHARRQVRALVQLGEAHRVRGDLDTALSYLDRALALSREGEQRTLALEALAELATVHEARGAPADALFYLQGYQSLRDSIFSQSAIQRIASMEARAEAERQERENVRLREEQSARDMVIARQRIIGILGGAFLLVSFILVAVLIRYSRVVRERERLVLETNATLEDRNRELEEALSEVQALKGLIPICVHCKNVRDDRGFWEGVEIYISDRSEALFSHSICTECGPKVYGEDWSPEAATAPSPAAKSPVGGKGDE